MYPLSLGLENKRAQWRKEDRSQRRALKTLQNEVCHPCGRTKQHCNCTSKREMTHGMAILSSRGYTRKTLQSIRPRRAPYHTHTARYLNYTTHNPLLNNHPSRSGPVCVRSEISHKTESTRRKDFTALENAWNSALGALVS